ncbi:MAG: hypothetical protein ACKOTB_11365, partial [Planctomycetia bacterium]
MRVSSARTFYRPFRGAARGGHVGFLVAALALFSRPPATAGETMGRLAHDDRLVVRGLTKIEPERLAAALVADDELLLLSRPLAQRKGFLTAVGEKATLALAHAGFASARATARVEADGDSEHVVVDVVEGPRHAAAGIRIDGLPPDLSERLHRWLLSHRPPSGAMPQAQDVGGEWSGTRWVDSRGLPARLEEAVWSPGQPAPFDPPFLRTVRTAVARFLRDEGYYAAARIVESPGSSRVPDSDAPTSDEQQPAASCDVAVRADAEGATLVIAFENLPPPATLQTIDVLPGARTTAADLERSLGIAVGERVTERDRLVWRERLRQSGRFVRHEVTLRELPGGRGTHPGNPGADVVATFDLEEYPPVPSLAEPLSREESVMLAFRSWLLETLANERDLVVACLPTADAAGAAASSPAWECVVSTREGAFFGALPGTDAACGVAVSADGLGCFLPSQAGSFTVPLRGRRRVTLDVSFSLRRGSAAGPTPFERQLQAGCGIEPRRRACGGDDEIVPLPHDRGIALVDERQAGDRLDPRRHGQRRHRIAWSWLEAAARPHLALEGRPAGRLGPRERERDVDGHPPAARQRHGERPCLRGQETAQAVGAHRHPARLSRAGQGTEERSLAGRHHAFPGGLRGTRAGVVRRRGRAGDDEIPFVGQRLEQPRAKGEHRGFLPREGLRQRREGRIFHAVDHGHEVGAESANNGPLAPGQLPKRD